MKLGVTWLMPTREWIHNILFFFDDDDDDDDDDWSGRHPNPDPD